jgi:cell division protein FtsN
MCGRPPLEALPATFSVQLGAFRSREAASDLRTRLTATGVSARLVEPEDPTGLYRVRSGRFDGREEAARHAVRLTDAGFEGIVVPEED